MSDVLLINLNAIDFEKSELNEASIIDNFVAITDFQKSAEEDEAQRITAVIISWGIYGASVEWRRNRKETSPETFIKSAKPFLMTQHHRQHGYKPYYSVNEYATICPRLVTIFDRCPYHKK